MYDTKYYDSVTENIENYTNDTMFEQVQVEAYLRRRITNHESLMIPGICCVNAHSSNKSSIERTFSPRVLADGLHSGF